jgi:hypothetical protein
MGGHKADSALLPACIFNQNLERRPGLWLLFDRQRGLPQAPSGDEKRLPKKCRTFQQIVLPGRLAVTISPLIVTRHVNQRTRNRIEVVPLLREDLITTGTSATLDISHMEGDVVRGVIKRLQQGFKRGRSAGPQCMSPNASRVNGARASPIACPIGTIVRLHTNKIIEAPSLNIENRRFNFRDRTLFLRNFSLRPLGGILAPGIQLSV